MKHYEIEVRVVTKGKGWGPSMYFRHDRYTRLGAWWALRKWTRERKDGIDMMGLEYRSVRKP